MCLGGGIAIFLRRIERDVVHEDVREIGAAAADFARKRPEIVGSGYLIRIVGSPAAIERRRAREGEGGDGQNEEQRSEKCAERPRVQNVRHNTSPLQYPFILCDKPCGCTTYFAVGKTFLTRRAPLVILQP